MTRYSLLTFAITVLCSPLIGCGTSENRTIEPQGELWDQRAAFYANESNFTEEENKEKK